jgi:molybdate/tungstate transport system substrate-binding protein
MRLPLLWVATGAAVGLALGACGCNGGDGAEANVLTIFHAGSLSVPLREVSALFEEEHPEITVRSEAAGSRDSARKICELGRRCDVMASADYRVVSDLLMPEYADFNIRFASNEMVIAYTARSELSSTVSAAKWHEILLADGVVFGRADPNRDPCGYRTLMVLQLADKHYQIPGLSERLREKSSGQHIRPKETDLLALLEVGEIDYFFIYRSVAQQHGLKMILLPDEINLKSPALAPLYRTAAVKLTGKTPGQFITRRGESMVYSVTIPTNALNRRAAEAWVALLLSPRGRAIMEGNGQPWSGPPLADGFDRLPEGLKPLCQRADPSHTGRHDDG